MEEDRHGFLFVISAPSGTGKSTLARALVAAQPEIAFSVSYTTRPRRPGEDDGREYHFVDAGRFDDMVARGQFLEWAHVFGQRYGTAREETSRALQGGQDLLLDIDVQGARQIRESGIDAVFAFVMPPDFATLSARLKGRRTEGDADLEGRLAQALREAEEFRSYDYLVINDRVERAVDDLRAILQAERRRVKRRFVEARRITASFPRD